jgi:hypothetical protein
MSNDVISDSSNIIYPKILNSVQLVAKMKIDFDEAATGSLDDTIGFHRERLTEQGQEIFDALASGVTVRLAPTNNVGAATRIGGGYGPDFTRDGWLDLTCDELPNYTPRMYFSGEVASPSGYYSDRRYAYSYPQIVFCMDFDPDKAPSGYWQTPKYPATAIGFCFRQLNASDENYDYYFIEYFGKSNRTSYLRSDGFILSAHKYKWTPIYSADEVTVENLYPLVSE